MQRDITRRLRFPCTRVCPTQKKTSVPVQLVRLAKGQLVRLTEAQVARARRRWAFPMRTFARASKMPKRWPIRRSSIRSRGRRPLTRRPRLHTTPRFTSSLFSWLRPMSRGYRTSLSTFPMRDASRRSSRASWEAMRGARRLWPTRSRGAIAPGGRRTRAKANQARWVRLWGMPAAGWSTAMCRS